MGVSRTVSFSNLTDMTVLSLAGARCWVKFQTCSSAISTICANKDCSACDKKSWNVTCPIQTRSLVGLCITFVYKIDPGPLARKDMANQEKGSDGSPLSHDIYGHPSAFFTRTLRSQKRELPMRFLASGAVALPGETEPPRRRRELGL